MGRAIEYAMVTVLGAALVLIIVAPAIKQTAVLLDEAALRIQEM